MPTSKRSFGLILLHAAVCSVGRKLTSPCLPARNKIRFSARQFVPAGVGRAREFSRKRFVSRSFRVTVLIPSGREGGKRKEEGEIGSFHTVELSRFDFFYIFINPSAQLFNWNRNTGNDRGSKRKEGRTMIILTTIILIGII